MTRLIIVNPLRFGDVVEAEEIEYEPRFCHYPTCFGLAKTYFLRFSNGGSALFESCDKGRTSCLAHRGFEALTEDEVDRLQKKLKGA